MNWLKKLQIKLEESVRPIKHDESVLKQSHKWMRSVTWSLIGTSAFGLGWIAIAQTEEIVVAKGILEPLGAVKEIQMPLGGIADKILVKDGERVSKGQILIQLDAESTEQELRSIKKSIDLKKQQVQLKQTELNLYLEINSEEVKMLESRLSLAKEILGRYRFSSEGASSELQYLQQKNSAQEIEGSLVRAKVDRYRQSSVLEGQLNELKSELSNLETQLTNSKITLKYQTLVSPVDGIVFDLKPKSPGYAARDTDIIMKVSIDNLEALKFQVRIYFVRDGMKADISIDHFPHQILVLEGTVLRVGSDALAPDSRSQRSE